MLFVRSVLCDVTGRRCKGSNSVTMCLIYLYLNKTFPRVGERQLNSSRLITTVTLVSLSKQ